MKINTYTLYLILGSILLFDFMHFYHDRFLQLIIIQFIIIVMCVFLFDADKYQIEIKKVIR